MFAPLRRAIVFFVEGFYHGALYLRVALEAPSAMQLRWLMILLRLSRNFFHQLLFLFRHREDIVGSSSSSPHRLYIH